MSAVTKPRYTFQEYLVRERAATEKSEYYRGQIFEVACRPIRHNKISGNLFAALHQSLRDSSCQPFHSDQRIRIQANGLATYPDVTIVCGEMELDSEDPDSITSPSVIFEVLSKSTERYDRGKKFDLYRELPSLCDYVLVSQDEPQVERFTRQPDGSWLLTVIKGIDAALELPPVGTLPLAEIFRGVTFGVEDGVIP